MKIRWTALVLVLACSASESGTGPAASTTDDPAAAARVELLELAGGAAQPAERTPPESPLWPQVIFLRAEAALRAGQPEAARVSYRELVEWAAADPYADGLGGSSLAIVALWRWVDLLSAQSEPAAAELEAVLAVESRIRSSHLGRRLLRFSFLDALPRLEEELTGVLAGLCWRVGNSEDARRLFLQYLELATDAELSPDEETMLDALIEAGELSRPAVVELQARRLERLRRHEEALPLWEEILRSGAPAQQDIARLRVAKLKARLFAADRSELAGLLTAAIDAASDPAIIQEALYARASVWSREGGGQDLDRYVSDLERLTELYPNGPWSDDALFRLASHYQRLYERDGRAVDLERALELFRRLRAFGGPNDWTDSAHFQPAMTLYSRGGRADLLRARSFLDGLVEHDPRGPLRRAASFWSARILEDLGEARGATSQFRAIVAARPYDYYGLRARMHLEVGARATGLLWPDQATAAALAKDLERHPAYERLSGDSAYHRRLAVAVDSDLYRTLLDRRRAIRERSFGDRLQNLPLARLDRGSDLESLVLLLALRQDALAAAIRPDEPKNALEVHAAVGLRTGDLPLAMSMAVGALSGAEWRTRPDADPRFLRSAYPPAFADVFSAAADAEQIPAELLYALARRESLFDPAAISTFSAQGLFQFIPSTFEALDERWRLLEGSGVQDRGRYLLDPTLNAHLGARWLADELIHRQNCVLIKEHGYDCTSETRSDPRLALITSAAWFDDSADARQQRVVLLALMEHSRGYTAVRQWLDRWRSQGRDRDLEYMIATAAAAETRILVRGVLTDASIAAAIGLFDRD